MDLLFLSSQVAGGGDDKNNTTKEADTCLEKVEEKALEDHKWVQAPVVRITPLLILLIISFLQKSEILFQLRNFKFPPQYCVADKTRFAMHFLQLRVKIII